AALKKSSAVAVVERTWAGSTDARGAFAICRVATRASLWRSRCRRAERAQERMDRARQQRNRPVSTALNGILIRAEDGIYYEDGGHKVDDTSWFGELPSVFRAPTSSPYAACLACDCRFSHVS